MQFHRTFLFYNSHKFAAVKQMLDEPPKLAEVSPAEKFNEIYKVSILKRKDIAYFDP